MRMGAACALGGLASARAPDRVSKLPITYITVYRIVFLINTWTKPQQQPLHCIERVRLALFPLGKMLTLVLLYYYIIILLYYYFIILLYNYIIVLFYYFIILLLCFYIFLYYIIILLSYYIIVLLYYYIISLLY